MKMRADRIEGKNAIARHGPDGVVVNGVEHTESVIVPWDGAVEAWNAPDFESLGAAHFARLAPSRPSSSFSAAGLGCAFPRRRCSGR